VKIWSALSAVMLLLTPCFSQLKKPVKTDAGLISGIPGRDAGFESPTIKGGQQCVHRS
jgi:hypothetical protein